MDLYGAFLVAFYQHVIHLMARNTMKGATPAHRYDPTCTHIWEAYLGLSVLPKATWAQRRSSASTEPQLL